MEKRGIPTVLISTDRFTEVCRAMAEMGGIPDMRWITVEHPIGSTTDGELLERAQSATKQFLAIILDGAH